MSDLHTEYEKWLGFRELRKKYPDKDMRRFIRNTMVRHVALGTPLKEAAVIAADFNIYKSGIMHLQKFDSPLEVINDYKPVKAPKSKAVVTKDTISYGEFSVKCPFTKRIKMTPEEIALIALSYENLGLVPSNFGDPFYKNLIKQGFNTEALCDPLLSRMFLDGHRLITFYGTYSNYKKDSNVDFFKSDLVGQYIYIPSLGCSSLDESILLKIKDTIQKAKELDIPTAFIVHSFLHSKLSYSELVTYKYSLKDYEWYNIYTNKVVEPGFHTIYVSVFDHNASLDFRKLIPDNTRVKVGVSIALSYKYAFYKKVNTIINKKIIDDRILKDALIDIHFKRLNKKPISHAVIKTWTSNAEVQDCLMGEGLEYVRPVKYYAGKISVRVNDMRHKCKTIKQFKKVYTGHDFDHDFCSMALSYYTTFDDFINIEEALFNKLGVGSETLVNPFCSHAIKSGKPYSSIHNDFMFGAVMSVKSYSTVMVSLSHFLVTWYLKSIESFTELIIVVVPSDKRYAKYTHFLIPNLPIVFNNSWTSKKDMMILIINGTKSDIKRVASALKELYQVG